jgi:hypothetical protein
VKPTRAQVAIAAVVGLLGATVLGATLLAIKWTADDPTDTRQVFVVGVVATLVSPIAFALLQAAWRQLRPPSLDLIRRQALAARQLERELADWQFAQSQVQQAEATRAEIELYIGLRTRSLDLERRYQSWESDAQRLYAEFQKLVEAGQLLDRDLTTELSAEARSVLDRIIEPEPSPWASAFDIFLATAPWPLESAMRVLGLKPTGPSRRPALDLQQDPGSASDGWEPSIEDFGDDVDWDRLSKGDPDPSDGEPGTPGSAS